MGRNTSVSLGDHFEEFVGFEEITDYPEAGRKYDAIENGVLGFRIARILHEQIDLKLRLNE